VIDPLDQEARIKKVTSNNRDNNKAKTGTNRQREVLCKIIRVLGGAILIGPIGEIIMIVMDLMIALIGDVTMVRIVLTTMIVETMIITRLSEAVLVIEQALTEVPQALTTKLIEKR
jgi:hypothetical protein